jgi:hypothetical protein
LDAVWTQYEVSLTEYSVEAGNAQESAYDERVTDEPPEQQGEGKPQEPQIFMDPSQMAGVWANYAQVSHSEHEFTLDFVRLDSTAPRGIVVARVSFSPLFVTQLIDALTDNWQKYAAKAMPREVHEDDASDS